MKSLRKAIQPALFAFSVLATAGCGDDASPLPAPDTTTDSAAADPRSRDNVCARWNTDRADRREGRWSGGSTVSCNAGTLDEVGLDNTLRQVNLFRWLADLPPVTLDPDKNAAAQACALVMDANNDIEHDVPRTWRCYSALGAEAAQLSNLATTPAVFAVDLYMDDEGIANLGHRRWILNNDLGPIGVGSTSDYSCMHLLGGSGSAPNRWVAWPSPGFVPLGAIHQKVPWGAFDIDRAGWSVQSENIDVSRASVSVTMDGEPVSVRTRGLGSGFGSAYGIAIFPVDFKTKSGSVYHVMLETPREVIDYTFEVVDCDR
jgi:hypothetical protein